MRTKFLQLCKKLNWKFNALYTWLLRAELKSCGEKVQFHYPVRLEQPGRISIGNESVLYPGAWINAVTEWAGEKHAGEVKIGNRVAIGYRVQISAAESVVIEDEVCLSAGVVIVDHIHDYRYPDIPIFFAPLSKPAPIRIGKGSFLGVNCLIGPGVQIGEHAMIAANAVVLRDVPSYCRAMGNPARVSRFYDPSSSDSGVTDVPEATPEAVALVTDNLSASEAPVG
jgi:acetyltransferase-like isoleucine patch superfamily enzyme